MWDNLREDLETDFSCLSIPEAKIYGETATMRAYRPGHKRGWRQWSAEERARAYARHLRYLQPLLRVRRAEKHTTAACLRPGCGAPLAPPGTLKPGPVPQTCSRRCSNAVAYLRRAGRLPPRETATYPSR